MQINSNKDLLEIFHKALKKDINIDDKDLQEGIENMLTKSNIKNFHEYVRTYQYRTRNAYTSDYYERYKHLKYVYTHSGDLMGHSGQIERIAFDNTGKHVLSGGTDGMIKFWDVDTGFLIHCFIGHRNLVNDLCFSKDGKLIVSCDFFGIVNIWDLETLSVRFTIREHIGVTFAEFFEVLDEIDTYNLVIILSNGLVKVYKFNLEGIIEEKENDFTIDEPYKAICITDGGRFFLRAGYWPYLILLDTMNLEKCIIFETNGYAVQTICAAKDCLKFAAGCNNWLIQWTFFYDGISSNGNFHKTSKNIPGYWRKNVIKIDMEETCTIENMCYLKNNFIVVVCSDHKIRIFSERILRYVIQVDEMGIVCPHPIDNVFAYYGQHLKFFYLDKLISSERINFNVNDCQFSNDGESFVIGDEVGNVKIYRLNREKYKIKEQFFLSDFEHFTGANDILYKELPYTSKSIINKKNVMIEDAGFNHFVSKYLDKAKYKRKYCDFILENEVNYGLEEGSLSSSEMSDYSSDSSDSAPEITLDNKSSEEDVIIRRRGGYKETNRSLDNKSPVTLRRNYVEPRITPPAPRSIRLRRNDNNEDEGLEFFHYQRRKPKRKLNKKESNESSEDINNSLLKKLRRNNIDDSTDTGPKIRLRRHRFSD
ncbi:hypothetical protein P3W45_000281 [Vairimorpha bombi]